MTRGGARYISLEVKIARFWKNVEQNGADLCWPWKRKCNKAGYGKGYFNGKYTSAHRIAFILSVGEVSDELHVLHRCDNRCCCNPKHLFVGTDKDNVEDALSKGRWPVGEKHSQHRLSTAQVVEIRTRFVNENLTKEELGMEYGVSGAMIGKIIRRERWKSV